MIRRHRVLGTIGYPGGIPAVPEPFSWSWGNMLAFTKEGLCGPDEYVQPERSKVSLHDWARNDLVKRMRGDWLMMFDTDSAFEPDIACRLVTTMNRYQVDVLTGIYSSRVPPHSPVLYLYNHETERNESIVDWDRNCEIFRVDSAGAGCLLIRRKVFERIAAELQENPFDRTGRKGEDHSFFERLRKLGIAAYCAWKIEVQHLEWFGVQTSLHYKPSAIPEEFRHHYEGSGFDRQGAA